MFVNSDNYIKYLKIWLIGLFLLIVLMVAVGGITRLTDSGLSITAWELFSGILPPLNSNDWNMYFEEYKKIPAYKNINYGRVMEVMGKLSGSGFSKVALISETRR